MPKLIFLVFTLVASLLASNIDSEQNRLCKSLPSCEKACKQQDKEACSILAKHFYMKNKKTSQDYYKRACDYGHGKACFVFANTFNGGLAYRDKQKNMELYENACEYGYAKACFIVGKAHQKYGERRSTKRSTIYGHYSNAKDWYLKACDQGYKDGCDYYDLVDKKMDKLPQ